MFLINSNYIYAVFTAYLLFMERFRISDYLEREMTPAFVAMNERYAQLLFNLLRKIEVNAGVFPLTQALDQHESYANPKDTQTSHPTTGPYPALLFLNTFHPADGLACYVASSFYGQLPLSKPPKYQLHSLFVVWSTWAC